MRTSLPVTHLLRCAVCRKPFEFADGEAALVLRHVAYGYDFVHDGPCLAAAIEQLFPEPGYDCPAFGPDLERRRVLGVTPAEGWIAVLANVAEPGAGRRVRSEPLRCWALVEHRDATMTMEGLVRDQEWLDEPGGAEFPEAMRGPHRLIGYASATSRSGQPEFLAA